MKEAQLTAAGIVKDVLEGGNLDKIFQRYLKEKKIPFILFVSTEAVGKNGYMTWDQIKELEKEIKENEKKLKAAEKATNKVKVVAFFTKNKEGSKKTVEFTYNGSALN